MGAILGSAISPSDAPMSDRQYRHDHDAYGPLVADALAVAQRADDPQCPGADNVLREAISAAAAGRRLPGQDDTLRPEELRDWRHDMGWSQTRTADALRAVMGEGTYPSFRTYQAIEAGAAPMPPAIEIHLARICGY